MTFQTFQTSLYFSPFFCSLSTTRPASSSSIELSRRQTSLWPQSTKLSYSNKNLLGMDIALQVGGKRRLFDIGEKCPFKVRLQSKLTSPLPSCVYKRYTCSLYLSIKRETNSRRSKSIQLLVFWCCCLFFSLLSKCTT